MPYRGDWKALFKDKNRRNRSAVFEWVVTDFLSNPERRYSPSFRVENYNFKVIVDPVGNPNVYFLEPGVSVYLACSLAFPVPPSTAATAALAAAIATGAPVAPGTEELAQAPGFPEAVAAAAAAALGDVQPDGGNGNNNNMVAAAAAAAMAAMGVPGQNGGVGNPPGDWECCCAFSLTACNQQRKGRNVTWHSSMLNDRFHKNRKNWGVHSLLPLTKLKDPASGFVVDDTLKLKVRLRLLYLTVKVVRTSNLTAHEGFGVVDTGAEADAQGDKTLTYELFHCTTLSAFKEMLVSDLGLTSAEHLRLWVFTQPWPDTVLCPREILVTDSSSNGQPLPHAPPPMAQNQNAGNHPPDAAAAAVANAPPQEQQQLALAPPPPANFNPPLNANAVAAAVAAVGAGAAAGDDDNSSTTLFSLLQLHMDGLGVARVWAECAGDGGFASTPATAASRKAVAAAAAAAAVAPPAGLMSGHQDDDDDEEDEEEEEEEEEDDEIEPQASQLSAVMATSQDREEEVEEEEDESDYFQDDNADDEVDKAKEAEAATAASFAPPFSDVPGLHRYRARHALHSVPLMPDSRDLCHQSHAAQTAANAAGGAATVAALAPCPTPSSDMHVLVFIKWLNPVTGRLGFLSHAVVKHHTPLYHLFAVVGGLVAETPRNLQAHVETTPATWQRNAHVQHRLITCPTQPSEVGGESEGGRQERGEASGGQMTLRDAGVENGQILTFLLRGMEGTMEEVYKGYLAELFHEACVMYYGRDNAEAAEQTKNLFNINVDEEWEEEMEGGEGQDPEKSSSPSDLKNKEMSSSSSSSSSSNCCVGGPVTAAGVTTEDEEKAAVQAESHSFLSSISSSSTTALDLLPSDPVPRPRRALTKHTSLKLEHVVNLFERFGYQSFRVRNVYYQHKHMNARQTLEYVIQGRHLGFCCDRCGVTDFTGPRFKCRVVSRSKKGGWCGRLPKTFACLWQSKNQPLTLSRFPLPSLPRPSFQQCYDYDLCGNCQEHPQAAAHRYRYEHRGWRRENQFGEHVKTHKMQMILPVPYNLRLLSHQG